MGTPEKNAVLLMAYGAPSSLDEVEPFYTDIRGGRRPTPELLEELLGRYRRIGGRSPLLEITTRQAQALSRRLDGMPVYVGMRHWTPWIRDAVAAMARDGVTNATAIVLAPHYSAMSIGKYEAAMRDALAAHAPHMSVRLVRNWHLHPMFLAALEQRVRAAMEKFPPEERAGLTVFFTAHSLPQRIVKEGDPYPDQLRETSEALAARLGLARWQFAFQSAGRTPEPWLGPDILDAIRASASDGHRSILVCVVGFIADHLEVLYDIDVDARTLAGSLGVHLERIEMLNDDPALTGCLADLAMKGGA